MIKKRLANGQPCAKCDQAEALLKARGLWERIDRVVWADENEPESEGVALARRFGVELAPFFLLEESGHEPEVLTATLKLVKRLQASPTAAATGRSPGELSTEEAARLERELAAQEAPEVVTRALTRFGQDCWLAFSGAEDVVLIDLAKASGLPFRVFCLDTGRLHAETYRFIDQVRRHYGITIDMVSPDARALQAFTREKGLFSFYEDGHSQCCGVRKLEPLQRALSNAAAWMTGQRADQSPDTRAAVQTFELDTRFEGKAPLLAKFNPVAHWTSEQVWRHIREGGIPYNALHDAGFASIGCEPCTRPKRPGEHERAARWWWEQSTHRECGLHVGGAKP